MLAYCLMPNHVHLVLSPDREDSLAVPMRRVHGRYVNIGEGEAAICGITDFFAPSLRITSLDGNPARRAESMPSGLGRFRTEDFITGIERKVDRKGRRWKVLRMAGLGKTQPFFVVG